MTDFIGYPKSRDTWEDDSFIVHRQFVRAVETRTKIYDWLAKHDARRVSVYHLVVDYAMYGDTFQFCLRVLRHADKSPVLELWAPTPAELMSDRNLMMLLVLFQTA